MNDFCDFWSDKTVRQQQTFTTNTGYVAGGDKFILRMAEDQDAFIKEMAEKPWQLFEETVDLLNGANQLVLKD